MIPHMARVHPASNKVGDDASDTGEMLHKLQETLRQYRLVFQATNDVLYDLDLRHGSVEWNEALYSQYGYDRSEANNTLEWWTGHVHPDDALLLENKTADLFQSDSNNWQYDYRFRRADGSYSYVRDRGVLLRDKAGKPVRIIGSLLDITAQKQLDTAKDEFISLVSHQLRTPLTVIRVYSEMLTNGMLGELTAEQTQWVRNITNSSARLIDVVGTILNVSRVDLGRLKIAAVPLDMRALIRDCIKEVTLLAEEKQVRIDFVPPKEFPEVALDETVFAQIVHNLLTNAIRYTSPQEGRVTVRLAARRDGYVVSVHDNGIGVPEEARDHIFERFYRAKNALNVETQGSGLGLYLVRVMTDTFGGKVWLDSANGTTFSVLIPRSGMGPRSTGGP